MVLSRVNANTLKPLVASSARVPQQLPPPRILQKDRDQAVTLYQSGLSLRAVSRELGISRPVIVMALDAAGIPVRGKESSA